MSLTKKLIGFDEDLLEKILEYNEKNSMTFSAGVRRLIELGYNLDHCEHENTTSDSIDLPSLVQTVKELRDDHEELKGQQPKDNNYLSNQVDELIRQVAMLTKNYSYFQADETQSKVGNLEAKSNEIEKKITLLAKVSKMFKNHINNREIHLQD